MATYTVGSINPDYPAFDSPPVANSDTAQVAYNNAVTINVLANDTDADTANNDQLYLGVGRYTDAMTADGHIAGTLKVVNNEFVFTADDPSFATSATTLTFSYTAVDQWGAESNWATVTISVTGNSTPGVAYDGTVHPDVIRDTPGNDTLYGGNNDDKIYSTTGTDVLSGGNGKDQLFAGTGNDTLLGGNGDDTLTAGSGVDILTGGHGNDLFVLPANYTKVTITDFDSKNDTIDMSPWVFQNFAQIEAHAQQHGADLWISTADAFDPSVTHTLVLQNTKLGDLHANDFLFV